MGTSRNSLSLGLPHLKMKETRCFKVFYSSGENSWELGSPAL